MRRPDYLIIADDCTWDNELAVSVADFNIVYLPREDAQPRARSEGKRTVWNG
jgi:hypothetical protein